MTPEHIAALKAELAEIDAKLADVKNLEARRRELIGSWHDIGEINRAMRDFRDSKFPIFSKGAFGRNVRIVEVSDKWIVLRDDGADAKDVVRFKRDTGWRERARDGRSKIDAGHALAIWEDHQNATVHA